MRSIHRWRAPVTALAMSVLAVGSLGVGVHAAALDITFEARYYNCVQGIANGQFRLDLRQGSDIIDTVPTVTPEFDGSFDACFAPSHLVKPGRSLRASGLGSTTGQTTFDIPTLTLRSDRVTDVVRGSGPANKQLQIRVEDCYIPQPTTNCPHAATRTVTVDGAGHYSKDFSGVFDLRGTDGVRVRYTSPAGHTYDRYLATASMFAVVDDTHLSGNIATGGSARFRLYRTPGGTLLSSRTRTGNAVTGGYVLDFAKPIRSGRQVTSDFATDARMTIPDMTTTFDEDGGVTRVRTRCIPGRKVVIAHDGGEEIATANSQGRVSVLLDDLLPGGSSVYVTCQRSRGDILQRRVLVP